MGTTIREILEEHAGGMKDGYSLRGIIPGGASTDFLLAEHLDVKMDYDSCQKAGSRLGTGTMIVLDDRTCPVGMVHQPDHVSLPASPAGGARPAGKGLPWLAQILSAIETGDGRRKTWKYLQPTCRLLGPGHTFCALAPGAMEPLQSALKYFRDDFERHINEKKCPWR